MRPHAADVDDGTATSAGNHIAYHGLGEQEHGAIQLEVGVVVCCAVVEVVLWNEESRRVDEQGRVRMRRELRLNPGNLVAVRKVGRDAPRRAVFRQFRDGLINLRLVPTNDDRAATVLDDIHGGLAAHAVGRVQQLPESALGIERQLLKR